MIRVRFPPTRMPATPSSQPLMTRPWPITKVNGALRSRELSNFAPLPSGLFGSYSQPVYCTTAALSDTASAPVPCLVSIFFSEVIVASNLLCSGLGDGVAGACAPADAVMNKARRNAAEAVKNGERRNIEPSSEACGDRTNVQEI